MATSKAKWISIMIVPEDGAGIRNWRISIRRYSMLKASLWAVAFLLFAGLVSSLASVYMYLQVHQYKQANKDLLDATSKIEIIERRLANYEGKERKLRDILSGDLDIPEPVSVEKIARSSLVSDGVSGGGFNELEDAISREESKLRKIPTIWPVEPWQITKEFKYTGDQRLDHVGIDILAREKSPVIATADGKVIFADMSDKLGLRILIDHENRWETEYGHNSTLLVKYGDEVKKGQTIAIYGGNDKISSGPHLHYAMYYDKKPVNPLDTLKPNFELVKKE